MTVAIVEHFEPDQQTIADYMKRFLEKQGDIYPKFYFYSSGEKFITDLSPQFFDIVILGCCMEEIDGIEIARELRRKDRNAILVFITLCRDYAVDGYLVCASGYLVKPFTYEHFFAVMSAACSRLPQKKERPAIPLQNGKQASRVFVDDIVYCDTDGHYVQFHLTNAMLRVRMTFAEASALLCPYPELLECYRGCIINLDHIRQADELNFFMDNGERVPLRRREHRRLLQIYSDYVFDKTGDQRQ